MRLSMPDVTRRATITNESTDHRTDWPEIVLVVAPCRSFSTALLRAMGLAGTPGIYQPLKTELRWEEE